MSHAQGSGTTDGARTGTATGAAPKPSFTEILFDLRTVIGGLFLVYGLVCLIWGITSFTTADSQRTGGVNLNLWAGLGMLVVGIFFVAWSLRKPVVAAAPDAADDDAASGGDGAHDGPSTRR